MEFLYYFFGSTIMINVNLSIIHFFSYFLFYNILFYIIQFISWLALYPIEIIWLCYKQDGMIITFTFLLTQYLFIFFYFNWLIEVLIN